MRKQENKPGLHYKEALQNNSRCNTSIHLTSRKQSWKNEKVPKDAREYVRAFLTNQVDVVLRLVKLNCDKAD